jgi:hypothetical protein
MCRYVRRKGFKMWSCDRIKIKISDINRTLDTYLHYEMQCSRMIYKYHFLAQYKELRPALWTAALSDVTRACFERGGHRSQLQKTPHQTVLLTCKLYCTEGFIFKVPFFYCGSNNSRSRGRFTKNSKPTPPAGIFWVAQRSPFFGLNTFFRHLWMPQCFL